MDEQQQSPETQHWAKAIKTCYLKRHRPQDVKNAFSELWTRFRIDQYDLALLIITSGAKPIHAVDPLTPGYIAELVELGILDSHSILNALLDQSPFSASKSINGSSTPDTTSGAVLVESVVGTLTSLFAAGSRPKSELESIRTFRSLLAWLDACNTFDAVLQLQNGGVSTADPGLALVYEAVGTFAIVFLSSDKVKETVKKSTKQVERSKLTTALSQFASTLSQWSGSQIASRLQMLCQSPPLASSGANGSTNFSLDEISSAVPDLPQVATRAGLYVYLNAGLCARPNVDDSSLVNFLHARYQEDSQSMIVDLIVAAFDVFVNALQRRENKTHLLIYRSFIANKMPLFLAYQASALYPPVSIEFCVQMALGKLDIHPFPPLSTDNDGFNQALSSSKKDFVLACRMHQLVSDTAAQALMPPNVPLPLARPSRYAKDTLVNQCTQNIRKAEELIQELDRMTGNAGAISFAITEVLQNLCQSKESMSLRTICNALSRRVHLLDILLQYVHLDSFLSPLLGVLNDWTHDEDQSEFQPAYEEFASILLLVHAVVHRYNLSSADLSSSGNSTFVVRLFTHLANSTPGSLISEEQSKHLTKWVQGLFATDDQGETTGISDETMSQCPPQDFYLLVPTLFEQSVLACMTGDLAINTLKGGLEFLLEPFLLPSLISALQWLINHAWEDHGDADILLQILDKLLRPASISGDAKAMHETIKTIIARPLEHQLKSLERSMPKRKDVPVLLEALQAYTDPTISTQISSKVSISEIKEAIAFAPGGLAGSMSDLIGRLVIWSSQSELNPVPSNYTHRIVVQATRQLTADAVLLAFAKEVAASTAIGQGSIALEVCTAMICASSATDTSRGARGRMSLRTALKLRLSDSKALLDMENSVAEALIRLGRLVDQHSVVSQAANVSLPLTGIETGDLMQGMDMTGADLTGEQMDVDQAAGITANEQSTADFEAAIDASINMDASNAAAAGLGDLGDPNALQIDLSDNLFGSGQDMTFNLDQSQQQQGQNTASGEANISNDDDIFAGLDLGDMGDDDFNF